MRWPRRRKYFIDKNLQARMLLYNGIYFMIIILSIGLTLFMPLYFEFTNPNLPSEELVEVANRVLYLHNKLWPTILAVFVILGVHSILISHRIAGPLYRFRMTFQDMIDGNLSRFIRIRKGDYLFQEQAKIEELHHMLRSKVASIKTVQSSMERTLHEILSNPLLETKDDLKTRVTQLDTYNTQLREEIGYFQLPTDSRGDEEGAIVKGK